MRPDQEHVLEAAATTVAHVVYGGAHLFGAETVEKLARIAHAGFANYLPDGAAIARCFDVDPENADAIHQRMLLGFQSGARWVDDYRIDFEDGYGIRSDAEEDAHADAAGAIVAAQRNATSMHFASNVATQYGATLGVRSKRIVGPSQVRAERTLRRFFAAAQTPVRVTIPKVESAAEVAAADALLSDLEATYALPPKSCPLEAMAETPDFFAGGIPGLRAIAAAAAGRPFAVHLGSYDLTASAGIPHTAQRPSHPILDHARTLLTLAYGGSAVSLSDGATTVLPIAPHRAPANDREKMQNTNTVFDAFRTHERDVAHALEFGIYQSWILHPMQLISHRVALVRFFEAALPTARARLERFLEGSERATRVGVHFDDAATGRGLVQFFLRARDFGMIAADDPLVDRIRDARAR